MMRAIAGARGDQAMCENAASSVARARREIAQDCVGVVMRRIDEGAEIALRIEHGRLRF
ncbi:hypothetical protein ACWAT4_24770 [Bradyrhizobium manausense]